MWYNKGDGLWTRENRRHFLRRAHLLHQTTEYKDSLYQEPRRCESRGFWRSTREIRAQRRNSSGSNSATTCGRTSSNSLDISPPHSLFGRSFSVFSGLGQVSPQLFLSTSLGGFATVSFFATGVAGATIAGGQLETPFYALSKRNQYVELGDVVTGTVLSRLRISAKFRLSR